MRRVFGDFSGVGLTTVVATAASTLTASLAMAQAEPAPPAPPPMPGAAAPQEPPAAAEPPPAAEAPATEAPAEPAAETGVSLSASAATTDAEAEAQAAAAAKPAAEEEPAVETQPAAAEPAVLPAPSNVPEVAPPAAPGWYDKLHLGAFVDSYYGLNFSSPKPQTGRNRFRAYDPSNGFALAAAGVDIAFDGEHFGGTLALRMGPSAEAVAGDDADLGLEHVKQAYATWRPGGSAGSLSLDFGKFDTIYGAEVVESHLNFNYTRGLLHWLAQPAFHTGLRATYEVSPQFWMTGLIVNGWNNSADNNAGKSFGLQLSTSMPSASDPEGPPLVDAHLGYLVGPEQVDFGLVPCPTGTFDPDEPGCNDENPENSALVVRDAGDANSVDGFRHLIDLIVSINPSRRLALLLNADLGLEGVRDGDVNSEELSDFSGQMWWGIAAMGRYQVDNAWAAALRAEIYSDPDARATDDGDPYRTGVEDLTLYSATLTLEYVPVANLILRLDARADLANEDVFPEQLRSYGSVQGTTTLGVVVTTD